MRKAKVIVSVIIKLLLVVRALFTCRGFPGRHVEGTAQVLALAAPATISAESPPHPDWLLGLLRPGS